MKQFTISIRAVLLLLLLLVAVPQAMAQKQGKKPFTVVIDAGHGGVDPGAVGRKSYEKNINQSVSKMLAEMINEELQRSPLTRAHRRLFPTLLSGLPFISRRWVSELTLSLPASSQQSRTQSFSLMRTALLPQEPVKFSPLLLWDASARVKSLKEVFSSSLTTTQRALSRALSSPSTAASPLIRECNWD